MTEEQKELREAVAKAICTADEQNGGPPWDYVLTMGRHVVNNHYDRADAAISVALERAAKIVEPRPDRCDCIAQTASGGWICDCDCSNSGDYADAMAWCLSANNAAAIRALIQKP